MAGFSGWVKTGPNITKQAIDATSTSLENALGTRCTARHTSYGEAEFIYLLGVASTGQSDWVTFDEAYTTARTVADAKGRVAIAMSANVASQYGWYCIYGRVPGGVLASFADNGNCFLTSTAGHVDDAVVAGDLIEGCIGRGAIDDPNTGQAWMELNYPAVDDFAGDDN